MSIKVVGLFILGFNGFIVFTSCLAFWYDWRGIYYYWRYSGCY